MRARLLALFTVCTLACDPNDGPGFRPGTGGDDSTTDDTADGPVDDCPPTFGTIEATIDDYPGVGWVSEVYAPFVEGTCAMASGDLFLGFDDGTGGTRTEGPFSIGFDDEKVLILDYDEGAGTGELFFAFEVDSGMEQVVFTMWVDFGGGVTSEHVQVTAS